LHKHGVKTIKKQETIAAGESSRRNFSCTYHLKSGDVNFVVCKTMFQNTLGVNEWMVKNWLDSSNQVNGLPTKKIKNTDNKSPCFTCDLTPNTKSLLNATRNLPSPSTQSSINSPRSSSKKSLFEIVNKLENTIQNQKKKFKNKRSSISKLRNNLSTYKAKYKKY